MSFQADISECDFGCDFSQSKNQWRLFVTFGDRPCLSARNEHKFRDRLTIHRPMPCNRCISSGVLEFSFSEPAPMNVRLVPKATHVVTVNGCLFSYDICSPQHPRCGIDHEQAIVGSQLKYSCLLLNFKDAEDLTLLGPVAPDRVHQVDLLAKPRGETCHVLFEVTGDVHHFKSVP